LEKFYSGSGSSYGSGIFPVPISDPDYLAQFFNKKIEQNLAFSILEAALFPRKVASNF
jgi:hypothetical protein